MTARTSQDDALIPAHLTILNAGLVEYALKDLRRRNGGLPGMRDLAELREILAAAARGNASAQVTYLTTAQAAAVMGLSARRIRQLAAAGTITAQRAGRDWLISAASARSYTPGEPLHER